MSPYPTIISTEILQALPALSGKVEPVEVEVSTEGKLTYSLRKKKRRESRRHEGRYLLHSNLFDKNPAVLWQLYMLLTQIEEAFRNLKVNLSARPIFHQLDHRIFAYGFSDAK